MKRDKAGYFYFVDRIGDTFRWKGENVSTQEVATVIVACPGVTDVTVYGVRVPGFDGRAGMAAIAVNGRFDPAPLYAHVTERLPSYARPMFIRIVDGITTTETFKQKKQLLIKAGFDPSAVTDALFIDDTETERYLPLTAERYARLVKRPALVDSEN